MANLTADYFLQKGPSLYSTSVCLFAPGMWPSDNRLNKALWMPTTSFELKPARPTENTCPPKKKKKKSSQKMCALLCSIVLLSNIPRRVEVFKRGVRVTKHGADALGTAWLTGRMGQFVTYMYIASVDIQHTD